MKQEVKNLIGSYKNLIETARSVIKNIYEDPNFNDEPRLYSFTATLKNREKAGGPSFFSKKIAFLKTLGEAIERYNLSIYRSREIIQASYNNLKEKAINPQQFIFFSRNKSELKFKSYTNHTQKLNWIKGVSLITNRQIFVPAQLIFVPYHFKDKEPIINLPISTGAACHISLGKVILEGLLEVCERDAFMINYLNKLPRDIIDINKSNLPEFKKIINSINRYNLELYIIDISTDVPVYSIMALIIDKTGLGPAVSVGIKSSLGIKEALIGAIEECLHGRFWIKEEMLKLQKRTGEIKAKNFVNKLKERGIMWSTTEMIDKINFFLSGKTCLIKNFPRRKARNLDVLLNWFKKKNLEVIYVDLTPLNQKRQGVYTIKVLVSRFQPLYFDERFACWEGERLKEVPRKLGFKPLKEVYKFPHPFL